MAYKQIIIGRLELCDLPELGLTNLPIKVDTGAKTSSIHVDNIKEFDNNGVPFIGFDIHPDIHNVDTIVHCQSKVHDHRQIKSSNGSIEERYVIQTQMPFPNEIWDIEVTLTIEEVNKREMAALNQELFDKLFGEGVVTSEKELKEKIKEDAERQFAQQGDQKLLNDVVETLIESTKLRSIII